MTNGELLPTALISLLLLLALGGYWVGTRAVAAWRRQSRPGEDDAAPGEPDTTPLEERLDALERRLDALEAAMRHDGAAPAPAPDESRLSRREVEMLLALDRRDEA